MWDSSDPRKGVKAEVVLNCDKIFTNITLYFMEVNSLCKSVKGLNIKFKLIKINNMS